MKNVPDVGIELGATCMPSELASDLATAPGVESGSTPLAILSAPIGFYSKTNIVDP